MAIILATKEYKSGLYDAVTDKSCITEKVVDVTEDCPGANKLERVIFLYTRDSNGPIIKICRPHPGEKYMGSHIHFFVNQLDREMNAAPRDDTFGSQARRLGLDKKALRMLIERHAP